MSDMDAIRAGVRLAACEVLDAVTTGDGRPFKDASRDEQRTFAEWLIDNSAQSVASVIYKRVLKMPQDEQRSYIASGMEAFTAGIADALGEFGFQINLVPVDLGQAPA